MELEKNEEFFLIKREIKKVLSTSIEHGINENSSFFFKINYYDTRYLIKNFLNKKIYMENDVFQKSADFELGGILNIFRKNNQVLSMYYSLKPVISHITPHDESFFSSQNSSVIIGPTYGFSRNGSYIELYIFDQIYFGNKANKFNMGLNIGTKMDGKVQFAICTSIHTGFENQLNPISKIYINQFKSNDYYRNKVVDNNLEEFFAAKRKTGVIKMSIKFEYKISNNTSMTFEIGGTSSKESNGGYFGIEISKTV